MSYFLRGIKKSLWLADNPSHPGQCAPSDLLPDFKTKNNTLSIWKIEHDKSNLCRVVSALSCNKDRIKECEYAIIDSQLLDTAIFNIKQEDGTTTDTEANKVWHYNIKELSAELLAQVATIFYANSEPTTLLVDDVVKCLEECIQFISIRRVSNEELKEELLEIKSNINN